jgi:hypothetical protein
MRKGRLEAKPVPTSAMAHKLMPPTIKTSGTNIYNNNKKYVPTYIVDQT